MTNVTPLRPRDQCVAGQIARAEGRPLHAAPTYVPRRMAPIDRVLWRMAVWAVIASALFTVGVHIRLNQAVTELQAQMGGE